MNYSNTTFIYALCEPDTGAIRYIGKSNDPRTRLSRHIKNALDGHSFHCPTWIRSVLNRNLKPDLKIIEECAFEIWKERETYWIRTYKEQGFALTNCKDGGDGLNPTIETKQKMRLAKLGKQPHNKGKSVSDETRQKLSQAAKERVSRDPKTALQNML